MQVGGDTVAGPRRVRAHTHHRYRACASYHSFESVVVHHASVPNSTPTRRAYAVLTWVLAPW